jgi:hypothetical protein
LWPKLPGAGCSIVPQQRTVSFRSLTVLSVDEEAIVLTVGAKSDGTGNAALPLIQYKRYGLRFQEYPSGVSAEFDSLLKAWRRSFTIRTESH